MSDENAVPDTPAARPNWWHRDHPLFTAMTGLYAGLAFVILVPGIVGGILTAAFDQDKAEQLFPLTLVTLIVPIVLLVLPRTRRFGTYMWIGMISTAIVVCAVVALVLWIMIDLT